MPRLEARPDDAEEGGDYFVDLKEHAVSATEEGVAKIEKMLNIRDLYGVETDPRLPRHFEQSLRAHALYKRDRDYIVKDDEIVIVDEFTGRQMPGRRWSEGLHQAVEAKEGVRVQRESMTMATVTFQNYFRVYDKLAGMTGTAMTEQEEFYKIYGLEVMAIPTHLPMIREDFADLVFRDEEAKFNAVIDEIAEKQEAGRPGPRGHDLRREERAAGRGAQAPRCQARGAQRQVPREGSADRGPGRPQRRRHHRHQHGRPRHRHQARRRPGRPDQSEAAQAVASTPPRWSRRSTRRSSTQAKAECDEDHERVVAAGGLHIIGTERHDARRIDNQLRGRSGRQGDPGSSRYFLSLEDALLKRFANERVTALMERMGLEGEVAIESRMVSKTVENAQSRVEGYNFDMRKRIVEYDDVINKQRERIYEERDKVLHNEDLSETVLAFVDQELAGVIDAHLGEVEADWDLDGLVESLGALGLSGDAFSADALDEQGDREDIIELHLRRRPPHQLDKREQEYGEETWSLVERAVLLRAIDTLWVEHLTELEDFRKGVGLRGYGGRDPLVEFKREAFSLYDELRGFIQHQVASTIFRVSVQQREAAPAAGAHGHAHALAGAAGQAQERWQRRTQRTGGCQRGPAAGAARSRRPVSSGGSATATSGATVTTTTRSSPACSRRRPRTCSCRRATRRVERGPAAAPVSHPTARRSGATTPAGAVRARSTSAATARPERRPRRPGGVADRYLQLPSS